MKKYVLISCLIFISLFINFNYLKAAGCYKADYANKTCDTEVNGSWFTNYKCNGVLPTRSYEAIDPNGNTAYVACYKCNNNDNCKGKWSALLVSGDLDAKGYYFQSYIYNTKSGKCERDLNDFISFGATFSAVVDFTYDDKTWKPEASGECPTYFGKSKSEHGFLGLFQWDNYYFTNKWENIDDNNNNVGETVIDEVALNSMLSCVENKINSATCSEYGKSITQKSIIEECEKGELKELHSDELIDEYTKLLTEKSNNISNYKIEFCILNSKCGISKTDYDKYVAAKEKDTNTKPEDYFTKEQVTCINNNQENVSDTQEQSNTEANDAATDYSQEAKDHNDQILAQIAIAIPDYGFGESKTTCAELLGTNLTKIVNTVLVLFRIAGAILSIVFGMLALIPAVVSKDQDALKKAGKKCVNMGIVLVLILLLPSLLVLIGNLFGYDLSCIV